MTNNHSTNQDILIGRQPIFDRKLNVFGYELLHRDTSINPETEGDKATSRILLDTFLDIGLESIVDDKYAFINLTEAFFSDEHHIPFDSKKIVLEVLENININDQVIQSVEQMYKKGMTIALDDFEFEAHWEPLIPYAAIIKVEVPAIDISQHIETIKSLQQRGIKLLAEKVETHEIYKACFDLGFDYFQGYYFAKPQLFEGKRLGENQITIIQLISELNKSNISASEVESIISNDPSLSLKILRYINSAAVAIPQTINSIKQAIVLMGLSRIRAMASLMVLSQIENKPSELFSIAIIRANMCADLIELVSPELKDTAYTIGLLSVIDALMDQNLSDIISQLNLSEEVTNALLDHTGDLGETLKTVIAFEQQNWGNMNTDLFEPSFIQQSWIDNAKKVTSI